MNTEEALALALQTLQRENDRLQQENARLREVLSTYPERQTMLVRTVADLRDAVHTLLHQGPLPPTGAGLSHDNGFTGVPPAPDEAWWEGYGPRPQSETMSMGDGIAPAPEVTLAEIPEEPGWSDQEGTR
jgi:hypothetical protein